MSGGEAALLAAGGLAAGIVNTLAGGGSLLTVPLLVMLGLPGTVANGTNRVGVLMQSITAAARFRAEGIWDIGHARLELAAVAMGAVGGALVISRVSDAVFETAFGMVMLVMLVPALRGPRAASEERAERPPAVRALLFFAIGLYGGAFQAGVGVLLIFGLAYSGFDLVRANGIKVVINLCFTLLALPVFVAQGQVSWLPALVLGAGFAAGGELGARLAVRGGERLIRPVLALAVVALAGRMLGLY